MNIITTSLIKHSGNAVCYSMFQEAAVVGHSLIQTYVMKIISYLSILKVATLFKTDNIFLLLCVFFPNRSASSVIGCCGNVTYNCFIIALPHLQCDLQTFLLILYNCTSSMDQEHLQKQMCCVYLIQAVYVGWSFLYMVSFLFNSVFIWFISLYATHLLV